MPRPRIQPGTAPSPRPPRRRRPGLAAAWLAAASLLLLLSLLRPLPQDDGLLLEVAGKPVDLLGQLQWAWQQASRRCGEVQHWPADSAAWQQARQVLAAYSPPASANAQPVQLLGHGDWLLAEVRWGAANAPLDPAIVPLRRDQGRWQVQAAGVWSGDTGLWRAPVLIRRYLRQRLPGVPDALVQCLDPQLPPFQR